MDLNNVSLKRLALVVSLAGLAWTLGSFVGAFIQFVLTTFAINPLLRLIAGN